MLYYCIELIQNSLTIFATHLWASTRVAVEPSNVPAPPNLLPLSLPTLHPPHTWFAAGGVLKLCSISLFICTRDRVIISFPVKWSPRFANQVLLTDGELSLWLSLSVPFCASCSFRFTPLVLLLMVYNRPSTPWVHAAAVAVLCCVTSWQKLNSSD